jgi:hypothetical protein
MGKLKMDERHKKEFEEIVNFLSQRNLSAIIYGDDFGQAVIAKSFNERLALINIADAEKEYVEIRNSHMAAKLFEEDLERRDSRRNEERPHYFG